MNPVKSVWLSPLTAIALAVSATAASANERESLEALRQTTLSIIEALVEKGVLSKESAEGLLKQAQQKAAVTAGEARKPEVSAAGKPVQRVPYLSEAAKAQIRNEVREEVLTQARAENWGTPNAIPSWVSRIRVDGDVRYRHQADHYDADNTPAVDYVADIENNSPTSSRALVFAQSSSLQPIENTTESRGRERIRMRLGLTAKVTDEVGVGLRLATGSTSDRVSTNQTLGQGFNKYQLLVDRAFVKLTPAEGLDVSLGRIPNPWFSTDMVWSENLNFEGVSLSGRLADPQAVFEPFFTVGAFPLREKRAPVQDARWLYGAQIGAQWNPVERTRLKFGLAYYQYQGLEGHRETDYVVNGSDFVAGASYGQSAYGGSLAQKGNTVYELSPSPPGVSDVPLTFGLAYRFKPLVLTMAAEFQHFSPYSLLATFEYARNTGFSQSDFLARAGDRAPSGDLGGSADGYHLKLALGQVEVREEGDWQASVGYKHVGSDAVLDAFTDSDLGLGGTNVKGFILGFQYGIYRNTSLGLRYLSANSIDSPINDLTPAKFGVNTLQVDLNVRF